MRSFSTLTGNNETITKEWADDNTMRKPLVHKLTSGVIDLSVGDSFSYTVTEDTTFTVTNAQPCSCFNILIENGGAGTITYPPNTKWGQGVAPTLQEEGLDFLAFLTIDGGVSWIGVKAALNLQGEDPITTYVTFSSPNSFSLSTTTKTWDGTMKYSTDAARWTTWNGETITSGTNNTIYVAGIDNTVVSCTSEGDSSPWSFSGSNISCSGNLEALLDHETVKNGEHPTLGEFAFKDMFSGASNLIQAGSLNATTISLYGCNGMYQNCTGLTIAPTLPATTIGGNGYSHMFDGCTGLTATPTLPATSAGARSYSMMFSGCTGITSATPINLTSLGNFTCFQMFNGCTSLAAAPTIAATTIATGSCQEMFKDCTSLTVPPALHATTMAEYCYFEMFSGCSGMKASTTEDEDYNIPFIIPDTGTGSTGGSYSWNYNMFDGTSGPFTGSPEINTTYYFYNPIPAPYMSFSSTGSFSVYMTEYMQTWDGTLQYSNNGKQTWNNWYGEEVSCGSDHKIYFRGINNTLITGSEGPWNHFAFVNVEASIYGGGTVEALLDYATVAAGGHPRHVGGAFDSLFYEATDLVSSPKLTCPNVTTESYLDMFYGCTSLTTISNLPALKMESHNYTRMYYGCTALKFSQTQTDECPNAYRIPKEGTGTTTQGFAWGDDMFAGTSGTFTGTPTVNTTYYTNATVKG